MKQTLDQMRIACAEVCGLRDIRQANPPSSLWTAIPIIQDHPDHRVLILAYHTDLNAMHEAEKMMTIHEYAAYENELCKSVDATGLDSDIWHYVLCATASQRLEAFLRVMKPEMFE